MDSLMYQQTHRNLSPTTKQSLYDTLCNSIGDALGHIQPNFRLLALISKSYFSYFYTVPKVYKTLIGAKPITEAFNELTTRISVICNDVLAEIFKALKEASIANNLIVVSASVLTLSRQSEKLISCFKLEWLLMRYAIFTLMTLKECTTI
jgi:hypothetical protein